MLPSNVEVALELDRIAEEREGAERQEGLVAKRREAFQIMQILEGFSPVLVGSVWRGTARRDSDIDITVYAKDLQQPRSALQKGSYIITQVEEQRVTKRGREEGAFHIHLKLPSSDEAEIVVRSPEEVDRKVMCEIYGDVITGLTTKQLRRILRESPVKRFLPA
jgi:hypothetical protein